MSRMFFIRVILPLILLGVTVFAFNNFHFDSSYTVDGSLNAHETRALFSSALKTVGPERAYRDIVHAYAHSDFNLQHNVAHIIGETLYESEGVSGIQHCEPTFAFGCYHGFFTRAVSSEGLGIISSLDDACGTILEGDPSACRHGIGHGILEYLGSDNLVSALDACLQTTQPNPVAGCTSGVFMEYNVPLREDENSTFSTQARLPEDDVYAPCTLIDPQFKRSCYYELPQWWEQIYDHNHRYIGSLCANLDNEFSQDCFLGYGRVVAPSANYNPQTARAHCEEIEDERGSYLCRASAAWSIMQDGEGFDAAQHVCAESINEFSYDCPTMTTL